MPDFIMRFVLLAGLLLAIGCAPKNRLLGRWDSQVTVSGQAVPFVHTFGPDGIYSATFEFAGATGDISGGYKMEGENLTVTPHSFVLDTSKSTLPAPFIEIGKAEMENRMKEPQTGKVEWTSDSEFTVKPLSSGVEPLTFRKRAES